MLPAGPSSSSGTAAVPKPSGLLSLGSAEDIAAKAAEIKEARKNKGAKNASTNAAKSKLKTVVEKLEDLDTLKESLPGVAEEKM